MAGTLSLIPGLLWPFLPKFMPIWVVVRPVTLRIDEEGPRIPCWILPCEASVGQEAGSLTFKRRQVYLGFGGRGSRVPPQAITWTLGLTVFGTHRASQRKDWQPPWGR